MYAKLTVLEPDGLLEAGERPRAVCPGTIGCFLQDPRDLSDGTGHGRDRCAQLIDDAKTCGHATQHVDVDEGTGDTTRMAAHGEHTAGHDEEQQHAEHHHLLSLTDEPTPQFQLHFMPCQRFAGRGEISQLVLFP